MVSNPKIKTVYSFVAATIMLDLNTPMGKGMVQQIHPFACQNLRQGNPEFNRLYSQVERENTPHELGTGMAASPDGFAEAFSAWLKSKGINITDADRKKKISVFGGDAQNPETGLSFKWGVLLYFDIDKSDPKNDASFSNGSETNKTNIEAETSTSKENDSSASKKWWEFWK